MAVKILRGTFRGDRAGIVVMFAYLGSIIGAFLFPALVGIVEILSIPGVFLAGQLHNWAIGQNINWLSTLAPQAAIDFTATIQTPIINGTIALAVLAVTFNVLFYYLIGKIALKKL